MSKKFKDCLTQSDKQAICTNFPALFKRHPAIDIGPGWENLIVKLCEEIVNTIKDTGVEIDILQIKEKFGTLRFYITRNQKALNEDNKYILSLVNSLISEAEDQSGRVCETCGSTKNVKTEECRNYYIKTLCKQCKFLYWL